MADLLTADALRADAWLSARLSRDAYRLRGQAVATAPGARDLDATLAELPRPAFVWTRLPTDDDAPAQALEALGFRRIETSLTLERAPLPATGSVPGPAHYELRAARPDDEGPVVALARQSFRWSRFHRDPDIPDAVADELKARWTANYFRGRRGDAMAVAVDGPRVAGFLVALVAADGALVIDLVAVAEADRGRGVAAALTHQAQALLPQARRLRVGTQDANHAAVAAYRRLGFEIVSACPVFHLHLDSAPRRGHRAHRQP